MRAAASVFALWARPLVHRALCPRRISSTPPLAFAAAVRPQVEKWLDTALHAEKRKRASLEKEAEAALAAERLSRWATLVVSNLYRIDNDEAATAAGVVVVEDWDNGGTPTELRFDSSKGSPREEAEAAFALARRMRRGSTVVRDLVAQSVECEQRLEEWRAAAAAAAAVAAPEEVWQALRAQIAGDGRRLKLKVDILLAEEEAGVVAGGGACDAASGARQQPQVPRGRRAETQKKQPHQEVVAVYRSRTKGWDGREFVSPHGVPILVGRNRGENEQLSLRIAREPDVWMHVRDSPGAHVVLRMSSVVNNNNNNNNNNTNSNDDDDDNSAENNNNRKRGKGGRGGGRRGPPLPREECLQMCADLAAFYSELRNENKTLVTFAHPRHVVKPSGAPLGAVRLREEGGTIVGRPASDLIPADLKAARERERVGGHGGSGGTNGNGTSRRGGSKQKSRR
jgi:predicted ribosome quality control (RQC) complex YloA/Tae2 family protein